MDEKSSESEAKPKITRSTARHIRRRRLISARRATENDTSIVTNVECERSIESENPENLQNTESLSKSKARRLRKKNRTLHGKSFEKSSHDKTENPDSLIRSQRTEESIVTPTIPIVQTESIENKKDVDVSDTILNETITTKVTASEHELFENEKNRQISENLKSIGDSRTCIGDDYDSRIITIDSRPETSSNFVRIEDTSERIIARREEPVEQSLIICDTTVSSVCEKRLIESSDDAASSILTNDTSRSHITNENNPGRMNSQEKSREQVKAEREAKKAAKAAAKAKVKTTKPGVTENAVSKEIIKDAYKKPETRGDVVDGEVTSMMKKVAIVPTCKKKTEAVECAATADSNKLEGKSKSELRAERRAKQEAQREAKQKQVGEKQKSKVANVITEIAKWGVAPMRMEVAKIIDDTKRTLKCTDVNAHEVNLFKHLYHEREQSLLKVPVVNSNIHPAIMRLGVQYAEKVIVGSNARCVALLAAIKQLIQDFERPSQADFTRGLEASLQESSAYLHHCRPFAVSMQNALKHLKWQMTQLPATTSDEDAKTKLGNAIDTYIQEQIQLADKAISITIQTKITNGDVILTYGFSSLIHKILCDAHDAGRQFRVVVVDGRPWLEGREQLRRLAKHGLECSYVLINALSFIMPAVNKVFLGAHAILANGAVMSRVGTAQVALMAKSFNVPVLVACETHKSCERVQTDSIVYNEIADADELARGPMGETKRTTLVNWRGKKSLNLLNITYDVTPADLVTAVVTELAILPCTSVPVILRIKPSEI